jgi:pimeloyl-ACP methyl ester carboxylesterase
MAAHESPRTTKLYDRTGDEITLDEVETNGIRMHVAEKGAGPLVILCHGFPGSWYSWRHQIEALSAAAFRTVAPDMGGYGQTEDPQAVDQFTLLHLVGDIIGLLDALNVETAVIAGHDWGAPVAWHAALLRPDRFRAVIGLSVPFRPRGLVRPSSIMPQTDDAVFYQQYFQSPGVAEEELEHDVRASIRSVLLSLAGEAPARPDGALAADNFSMVPREGGLLGRITHDARHPPALPGWITDADIDFYAGEFLQTGFRGGLNWYRNIALSKRKGIEDACRNCIVRSQRMPAPLSLELAVRPWSCCVGEPMMCVACPMASSGSAFRRIR